MISPLALQSISIISTPLPANISEYFILFWEELTIFVHHYIIVLPSVLLAAFSTWRWCLTPWKKMDFLRRFMRHTVPLSLILAIFVLSKYNTVHAIRLRMAQEARLKVENAFSATEMQLEGQDVDSFGQLIILSQGVGEVTTRTFDLLQDTYPESDLRTLSVFLELPNNHIEDVIRVGELDKDRSYFIKSSSFIGMTISTGERQYCPDLLVREKDPRCKSFSNPIHGNNLEFRSLICYPMMLGENSVGGICLDSKKEKAFTNLEDKIWDNIKDEVRRLATLLHALQRINPNYKPLPNKTVKGVRVARHKQIAESRLNLMKSIPLFVGIEDKK